MHRGKVSAPCAGLWVGVRWKGVCRSVRHRGVCVCVCVANSYKQRCVVCWITLCLYGWWCSLHPGESLILENHSLAKGLYQQAQPLGVALCVGGALLTI